MWHIKQPGYPSGGEKPWGPQLSKPKVKGRREKEAVGLQMISISFFAFYSIKFSKIRGTSFSQKTDHFFFFNFYWRIVDLQCCVIPGIQQSESVTHIHRSPFLDSFSCRPLQRKEYSSLCYNSRSLLIIYFTYSSVYLSVPKRDRRLWPENESWA